MRRISRDDLLGAFPVFLLEVVWGGRIYRFSTYPVDLIKADGSSVHYTGGLADPDLDQSIEDLDTNPEKNTLSVELVFDVDFLEEFFKYGRSLDGAKAELSMVTDRNGVLLQTYDNRTKLFSGSIIQPIIGDPEQPTGYAAFTIERNPNNKASPIISSNGFFRNNVSITPSIPIEFSDGQAYPLVFGAPHKYFYIGIAGTAQFQNCYPSPAFLIYREWTIGPGVGWYQDFDKFWLCIALGEVAAATVTIRDYQNNIKTGVAVKKIETAEGLIISYVELQYGNWNGGSPIPADGIVNPWMTDGGYASSGLHGTCETDEPRYYVSWNDGGALLNTVGPGYLEGAGDVIAYFLDMSGVDIDRQAWQNISGYLNQFKFGGYINDPEITPYVFLQDNIFPFVPVQAVNGANGIRPVVPLIYISQIPRPVYEVELGAGFYFVSAVDWASEPDDILNRLLINYAFCLLYERNVAFVKLENNLEANQYTGTRTSTTTAQLSYTQYGDRYQEFEASYIFDFNTAIKTAQYLIRKNALPKMRIEIQADSQYGWLELGDILSVTSSGYFMDKFKMQIVEKSWSDGSWLFVVELENNVAINQRG